ncbi:inner membrane transport protein yieO [Schizosaccharomyces japonicus yFS275]|uniref:Inner membrane transport protein yieO n=1 Tax=Schizosaccharomyces japonicus (strain yFS275 / FY16936) TaxID=402676 RepID=B6K8A5_SCHJY|nr:inner membrane transport protein yieO [Schizosaccharomyces japonicus yFS275]EEB09759.1 inner membrane transport protein yieO [Schizosaccharomyces japonicus yFS275]
MNMEEFRNCPTSLSDEGKEKQNVEISTNTTLISSDSTADLEKQLSSEKEDVQSGGEIPENNMPVVMVGILMTVFLAALDSTIVTTAIPTIVRDMASDIDYSWIGSSYTLALTAVLPFLGVASDILGRKVVLYSSIFFFLLGSALCGASKSMIMLIVCRAVQGIGGGGITSLCFIVISDITTLANRSFYISFIASVWGIASVVGPLLGGIICQRTTWRWIFFINLPTGGVCVALLVFFLHLPVRPRTTYQQFLKTFDFVGLFTCILGIVLLLLGLSVGSTSNHWSQANVIAYIVVGVVLLIICAFWEATTKRNQILPPFMFNGLSKCALLLTVFLHNYNYMLFAYYLPEFYQNVKGNSPIISGVHIIAPAFLVSTFSFATGMFIKRTKNFMIPMYFGWVFMTAGMGALINIVYTSPVGKIIGLSLIFPVGAGCMFLPPLLASQAATPPQYMAVVTSVVMFVRNVGGSVGIIVGKVIYTQDLTSTYKGNSTLAKLSSDQISALPQTEKTELLTNMGEAYRLNWIVGAVLSGIGLVCLLAVRKFGKKQN